MKSPRWSAHRTPGHHARRFGHARRLTRSRVVSDRGYRCVRRWPRGILSTAQAPAARHRHGFRTRAASRSGARQRAHAAARTRDVPPRPRGDEQSARRAESRIRHSTQHQLEHHRGRVDPGPPAQDADAASVDRLLFRGAGERSARPRRWGDSLRQRHRRHAGAGGHQG
jgi:hypothetical protein